tara:strand:+ start:1924 stop:2109 length:186 start_codon:yes stop_codon:yes gene_type:complete
MKIDLTPEEMRTIMIMVVYEKMRDRSMFKEFMAEEQFACNSGFAKIRDAFLDVQENKKQGA